MPILPADRLNHVAKSKRAAIHAWKEGVALEHDSGGTIQVLLCNVAAARWELAFTFRRQANKIMRSTPPIYRSAISRYYYSMYHAMRACVFLENQGDDHELHSVLPTQIPATLDPGIDWQTKLKNARLMRNDADYDAFPKTDGAWKSQAEQIRTDASSLLIVSKTFLIAKGCVL